VGWAEPAGGGSASKGQKELGREAKKNGRSSTTRNGTGAGGLSRGAENKKRRQKQWEKAEWPVKGQPNLGLNHGA